MAKDKDIRESVLRELVKLIGKERTAKFRTSDLESAAEAAEPENKNKKSDDGPCDTSTPEGRLAKMKKLAAKE